MAVQLGESRNFIINVSMDLGGTVERPLCPTRLGHPARLVHSFCGREAAGGGSRGPDLSVRHSERREPLEERILQLAGVSSRMALPWEGHASPWCCSLGGAVFILCIYYLHRSLNEA